MVFKKKRKTFRVLGSKGTGFFIETPTRKTIKERFKLPIDVQKRLGKKSIVGIKVFNTKIQAKKEIIKLKKKKS